MSQYTGQQKSEPTFFEDTAPDGTRNLVYYQPVTGPTVGDCAERASGAGAAAGIDHRGATGGNDPAADRHRAGDTAGGLKGITNSLQSLAIETVRIAQGQLDHALKVDGVDEVGQLGRSFEQMRLSLQARMAELNRLLLVSQGVASSLDVDEAVQPVLEAVLTTGAGAVRMIIPPMDEP